MVRQTDTNVNARNDTIFVRIDTNFGEYCQGSIRQKRKLFADYFVIVAVEVAPSHATLPPSASATKRTGM